MQGAFHPCPLLYSLLPNSLPTTSKLIPSATPRRRFLSIPSTTTTTNLPHSSSPSSAAPLDDYQRLFTSQPAESTDPLPLLPAEGTLPSDFPLGTYYLAGPGMMADDHGSTVNPLDGHGYLRAFHFIGGGAVMYSARYVETEAAREERTVESGEWRFRRPGPFSMFNSLHWTSPVSNMLKNVANTTVLRWGGRLFCLWEGGHPYELEPTSLETIGPVDLITTAEGGGAGAGEVLNLVAGITKRFFHAMLGKHSKRTLSHYKIDAQRNRLLLLSCDAEDIFLPQSNFTFYEFDSNFELQQKKEFLITEQLLIHDWAFTDSFYIIMGNRTKTDLKGTFLAAAGLAPAISSISVNSSQPTTPIYLLPRFSDNIILPKRDWTRAPTEAPCQLWTMHMGNAFEEQNGEGNNIQINVQASVCSYQWFSYRQMFGYDERNAKLDPAFMNQEKEILPHLVQISIELDGKGSCISCSVTDSSTKWRKPCDFPVINPSNSGKANRFMYASSTSGSTELLPHFPYDTVVKIDCSNGDVRTWSTESRRFIGEPMFVPKRTSAGDEEDGYVVVVEYAVCRHRCYLVVLDAKRIGDNDGALVVKLEVPEHLTFPFGFHGFWEGN